MTGTKLLRSVSCLIATVFLGTSACADTIFEDRFDTLDRWELADKGGGSSMSLEPSDSVPEPYGPTVLSLRGEYAMALVRDLVVGDCTITALWRDVEPDDYDADGVLAARAMQPPELKGTPLAEVGEGLYWIEQDSDEGFQIKARDAKEVEETLASFGERSLTNDRTWNKTGWIWQKWQLDGSAMRAKFWPIHEPEPNGWQIHADNDMFSEGRVGLRVWSGHAQVAYFCVSAYDERVEPIRYYLGLDRTAAFDDGTITVTLYTQLERGIADVSVSFRLDDSETKCVKRLAISQGANETVFIWNVSGLQTNAPNELALGRPKGAGTYSVHISVKDETADKVLYTGVREVRIVDREAVSQRIARLRERAREVADRSVEGRVVHDVVIGLIELASSHYAQGNFEKAERPLGYADEAIESFHEERNVPCLRGF
jgi:hypothetical protein